MDAVAIPPNLENVLDEAWEAADRVPGFLVKSEARFLGTVAACAPGKGSIVEIGSFKGRSTVMLAKVAKYYGLGPIVSIDPHGFNSAELQKHRISPDASSFQEFCKNLEAAGVSDFVDIRRALSSDVSPGWTAPIRFLWIDGDHSYEGARQDFEGFSRHLVPQGIVGFHDALHAFAGPIRVFVEEVLRCNEFGPAGFVHSIAWSQFRPYDGRSFAEQRARLEQRAERLIPLLASNSELHGLRKLKFKLLRSRVPRTAIAPGEWASVLDRRSAR